MASSSIPTVAPSVADADLNGGSPITGIHPYIVQSHILNRLDGPTVAITRCASVQFLSLCNDDNLWKDICNSTWPSTSDPRVGAAISAFPAGHRSFFSDAFPALRHYQSWKTHQPRVPETTKLISAVDIYFDDESIHSKVLVTETLSTSFLTAYFRLEVLEEHESVETPLKIEDGTWIERAEEGLRLSWILIDPIKRRALNVASQKAVEVRRHWLTNDIQLRFSSVLAVAGAELVLCVLLVTCGGKEEGRLRVKAVAMQMEEMEGNIATGMESLSILDNAMEGQRWKKNIKKEKDIYEKFIGTKVQSRLRKQETEREWDTASAYVVTGICIFFALGIFFLWSS